METYYSFFIKFGLEIDQRSDSISLLSNISQYIWTRGHIVKVQLQRRQCVFLHRSSNIGLFSSLKAGIYISGSMHKSPRICSLICKSLFCWGLMRQQNSPNSPNGVGPQKVVEYLPRSPFSQNSILWNGITLQIVE